MVELAIFVVVVADVILGTVLVVVLVSPALPIASSSSFS
jgi:hypothetical protein